MKYRGKSTAKEMQTHAPACNVVIALAKKNFKLSFGYLARGDGDVAKPKIGSMLSRPRAKRMPVSRPSNDPGAIPYLMSEQVMERSGLQHADVGGRLNLAINLIIECTGTIKERPVTSGILAILMKFSVLADATYPILVGNPALKSLCYRMC